MQANILDTFRCTQNRILYKDLHIQRVQRSFQFFSCPVDLQEILKIYNSFETSPEFNRDHRVRIEFSVESEFCYWIESTHFQKYEEPIRLRVAEVGRQLSGIGAGNYKTTAREYWTNNESEFEPLGVNEYGFVTETARFNLFFLKHNTFFTPSLSSGCLRGVFREHSLCQGCVDYQGEKIKLVEQEYSLNHLTDDVKQQKLQIFVGNSVQGLLKAEFAAII